MRLLSAEGQRIAPAGSTYGYDVVVRIGWWRQVPRPPTAKCIPHWLPKSALLRPTSALCINISLCRCWRATRGGAKTAWPKSPNSTVA